MSAWPHTNAWLAPPPVRRELLVSVAAGLAIGTVAVMAATRSERWPSALVLTAILLAVVALVVGEVRRPLLALVVADTAIGWDVNLRFRADLEAVGSLPGLNVSLTSIGLAGLWLLWLLAYLARDPDVPRLRVSWPAAAYVAVVALSLGVAVDAESTMFEVALAVQTLLLLVYLLSWVRTAADVRFVAAALLVTALVEIAAMAALHEGLRLPGIPAGDPHPGQTLDRLGGTFGSPNEAASFLVIVVPLALVLALAPVGRSLRVLAALTFAAGLVALVLTFSRGGWLGLTVALATLAVLALRRRVVPLRRTVLALAVAAVALAPFLPTILTRLTQDDTNAAGARVPLIDLAWRIFSDHPVLGVGANGFGAAIPSYATPDLDFTWLYTVHDRYLLVLAETGLVGLLAFLWFLCATLRRGLAATRAVEPVVAAVAIGLFAGLVGFLAHALVDVFNSRPQVQLLFLVAAMLMACARLERSP